MNYNYVMSTGSDTLSGSKYQIDERNRFANKGEQYTVDFDIISGRDISTISLNSQTLFEGQPIYSTGTNQVYVEINSGDYFFDPTRNVNKGKLFLDIGLPVNNSSVLLYDKTTLDTGALVVHTGGNPTGALADLTDNLISQGLLAGGSTFSGDLFTGWDVFSNGQKFASYEEFTGLSISTTGRCFAIKKQNKIFEYNSGAADSFGQKFIPKQVDFYINGTEQKPSDFVLTYTGVNLLVTGQQAISTIYVQESKSYNL
jgi:hypothetical protein